MKVYSMNVSGLNPDDKKWYKYLSDKRIEKVEKLKKPRDKARSIGAELLLNYAVNGSIYKKTPYDADDRGRPYLTENEDLYISLSHSGDYAVCAISDAPVGVDVQFQRGFDIKTAERFFSRAETEHIKSAADREKAFFEIWTKKESLLKAAGTGITVPLSAFSVLGNETDYGGASYHFKEYSVSRGGYTLFVCSASSFNL